MLELTFARPLANKSDTEKCSYLLLYIGQDGRDIYNTWVLTDDEKKRPKIILDKFKEYCNPSTNITMGRHIFFSRNLHPGETIDNYATNIRLLAKHCKFGDLFEGLLKDRIICGIQSDVI